MKMNDFIPMPNLAQAHQDNPFWYKNERDGYLHEVTDQRSNANLDMGLIELEYPTAEEAKAGIIAWAEVTSNLGSFPVAVVLSAKSSECLELRVPKYLLLNRRTAAQVLRYVETQCVLA